MRTILLVPAAVLGACASDPETPPAPPMPSARAASVVDGAVPSTAAACRTRYRYPGTGVQIDCSTALVDGDAEHWVTSCSVPPGLGPENFQGRTVPPLRYEATAEDGLFLHEQIDLASSPTNYIPWRDVSYSYDSENRLAEVQRVAANGVDTSDLVIGPRDAEGKLLSFELTQPPLTLYGTTFPATARSTYTFQYDTHDRLVADQGTYEDGWKYWDETIHYDDFARRRDRLVILDLSGVVHDGTGPGRNPQHEFLDARGRLLTQTFTRPDGDTTALVYRYDDKSRLSSLIATRTPGFSSVTDYIYECQ